MFGYMSKRRKHAECVCLRCGVPFPAGKKTAKFCSNACYVYIRRNPTKVFKKPEPEVVEVFPR